MPKIIVGVGILAIVFAFANGFERASPSANESSILVQKPKPDLKPGPLYSKEAAPSGPSSNSSQTNSNQSAKKDAEQSEQPQREKRTSDETVYYCGAITKKGTPCTRRVKTKGFCWQHAKIGQIAPARF